MIFLKLKTATAHLRLPNTLRYALKCLFLTLGFAVLFTACGEELPEEQEEYVFKFGTHVDAAWLDCGYKGQEKCGDAIKRELRAKVGDATLDEQVAIGNDFHQNLPYPIADDAERQAKVENMIEKMQPFLKNQDLKHVAYVLNTPAISAFTIPGGNIYVTVGLMEAMPSDDALAYVIGHELGHNENDHTKESAVFYKYMKKQEADGGIWAAIQAMYVGYRSNYCGQADELESDITGIYLAEKAGYNPFLAIKAVEVLKRMDIQKPESTWKKMLIDILRSHPWSDDRERCLKDYVANAHTVVKCAKVYSGEKGVVNTRKSPLVLRALPSVNAEKVASLPKGSTVKLICDCVKQTNGNNFIYIHTDDNRGWVDASYIASSAQANIKTAQIDDDDDTPVVKSSDCKVKLINLHCETTTLRGFDDEIRIWVNDEQVGKDYYKIGKGDSKGVNVSVPFGGEAAIKIKDVDTFNDDELGENSVSCDEKGVHKLTFKGKGAKYTLSYQILK